MTTDSPTVPQGTLDRFSAFAYCMTVVCSHLGYCSFSIIERKTAIRKYSYEDAFCHILPGEIGSSLSLVN